MESEIKNCYEKKYKEDGIFNTKCKVKYIHVKLKDIKSEIEEIISIISNKSWVYSLLDEGDKLSLLARIEPTINKLVNNILNKYNDKITSEIGEYLITYTAQAILKNEYAHYCLPIPELWKERLSNNQGFDFHTLSNTDLLMFGEAKYRSTVNAYGAAIDQIVDDFIPKRKDISEILDLKKINSKINNTHYNKNKRGFIAAFSLHNNFEKIFETIKKNQKFSKLLEYPELYFIGIEL